MPDGFLPSSVWKSKPPLSFIPKCEACGLYKTCNSPKMKISGDGEKGILIIGETPGSSEDRLDQHFVGKSGKYLSRILRSLKIDMRKDCWLTNALICRPETKDTPKPKIIEHCRPNVLQAIKELNPRIIILAGEGPFGSLM